MNRARKQRCNATHMDDAGYKHSCKLLTGHPGDHECSKSVHSWADYKRPMNPKLDAGLAERLWIVYMRHKYNDEPQYSFGETTGETDRVFRALANEVRKIVKEAKEGE